MNTILKIIKLEMAYKKWLQEKGVNPFSFTWSFCISTAQTILLLLILLSL